MIKEYYREQIDEIVLFINQKNLLQAKNKIEILIKKYPEDFFLENIYGTILLNLEDIDSAINIFELLIKKNPNNSIFYFNLASCYKKKNLIEKTI
jgi:predicted Zn-dependent protease